MIRVSATPAITITPNIRFFFFFFLQRSCNHRLKKNCPWWEKNIFSLNAFECNCSITINVRYKCHCLDFADKENRMHFSSSYRLSVLSNNKWRAGLLIKKLKVTWSDLHFPIIIIFNKRHMNGSLNMLSLCLCLPMCVRWETTTGMHRKSTGRICRAIFENSYLAHTATTKTGCTHFLPTPTPKTLQFVVHKFFGVCNSCFHPPFHFRCELCPVSFLSAELLSVPSLTSMVNWMISAGVIALKGDCKHTFINTHTQAGHWFGLCTWGIYQLGVMCHYQANYFNRPVYTQKSNTEYPLKIKFCSTFRKSWHTFSF